MVDWVNWFRNQLRSSGDGFVWAFSRIRPDYYQRLPPHPNYLGRWSPARHVWHVTGYERCIAMPSMRQWLGDPLADGDAWVDDDETWGAVQDLSFEGLTTAFLAVRQQQIELLDQLTDADWETPRETIWGDKPLSMVLTKTYQHTFEHGDTLLRMGLWWEQIEREIAEEEAKKAQS